MAKPAQKEKSGGGQLYVLATVPCANEADARSTAKWLRAKLDRDVDHVVITDSPVREVWGVSDVAEYLGVSWQNLYGRKGMPEPVQEPNRGKLWLADEIREWAEEEGLV